MTPKDKGSARGACVAIIPARGGSKGVPRKNLRPIGGIPLIGRTVRAAVDAATVDAVIVSTDDADIATAARTYGAEVIDRPAEIAGDTASSEAALLHVLAVLADRGEAPATIVFLQCTSPFTSSDDIDRCVRTLEEKGVQSALAVAEDHGFLWTIGADGLAKGVNHDDTQPRKRRQDLPPQYRETGSIYVMQADAFLAAKTRFCGRSAVVPLSTPSVEIDSESDLAVCEAIAATMDADAAPHLPAGIKALVMDFDGVLTDDRVRLDQNGVESVVCSRSDGYGLELLRKAGYRLLILSKERNPVVTARGAKLKIEVRQGIDDKLPAFDGWLAEQGLTRGEAAYVASALIHTECLGAAGWTAAPADAHPSVRRAVRYVARKNGGDGAVREIAERLLGASPTA